MKLKIFVETIYGGVIMEHKYSGLYSLIEQDREAKQYFSSLPEYIRSQISQRADGVNSFESLCHYAENLLRGDD